MTAEQPIGTAEELAEVNALMVRLANRRAVERDFANEKLARIAQIIDEWGDDVYGQIDAVLKEELQP